MTEAAKQLKLDGFNDNQNYSYSSAQQYKAMMNTCLRKNRLYGVLNDKDTEITTTPSGKMALTKYLGEYTVYDVDSEESLTFSVTSQGADSNDKGSSKAKTLAIKDMIKANFMLSDPDDDPERGYAPEPQKKVKFVSPTVKKATAESISKKVTPITDETKNEIIRRIEMIRKASGNDKYGEKTISSLDTMGETDGKVNLTKLERRGADLGIVFEE